MPAKNENGHQASPLLHAEKSTTISPIETTTLPSTTLPPTTILAVPEEEEEGGAERETTTLPQVHEEGEKKEEETTTLSFIFEEEEDDVASLPSLVTDEIEEASTQHQSIEEHGEDMLFNEVNTFVSNFNLRESCPELARQLKKRNMFICWVCEN